MYKSLKPGFKITTYSVHTSHLEFRSRNVMRVVLHKPRNNPATKPKPRYKYRTKEMKMNVEKTATPI